MILHKSELHKKHSLFSIPKSQSFADFQHEKTEQESTFYGYLYLLNLIHLKSFPAKGCQKNFLHSHHHHLPDGKGQPCKRKPKCNVERSSYLAIQGLKIWWYRQTYAKVLSQYSLNKTLFFMSMLAEDL